MRVFLRVAMPLARPAIAVGVSLALMEALNDIGASEFLGIRTLTVAIYTTWTVRMSVEGAAQIALVMLAVVFALILLERWARRRQRYSGQARRHHTPTPQPLAGLAALGATRRLLPSDPLRLPRARRAISSSPRGGASRSRGCRAPCSEWIGNSVTLAAIATVVAILVGLVLVYSVRLSRNPAAPALVRLASIGYAVPGTVLAVGLLVPLASLDNRIADLMRASFGVSTGLLLTGSGAALILAYVLRFLAISAGRIEAGLAKVSPHLDMAARSLGSRPAKILATIHLPLICAGDRRRGGARLRRRDEGAAGDAAPAALQLHHARDRALRRSEARHLRGRRHRRAGHRAVGLIPVIVLARINAGFALRQRRGSSAARAAEVGGHI